VLAQVGEALGRSCRSSDLAFRVGGDEFAYILPEANGDAAVAAARRARLALAALPGSLDVSYGITTWPEDGPASDELLASADDRLYEMKRGHAGELPAPVDA
jgi:diguanylate cyclase (GGDEF)-like protein